MDDSLPQPQIILMDVQMPIMDGYRATYTIRNKAPFAQSPRLRTTPIVAMTASAIQGDREKCQRAGMDDYLAKPVKGKVLEKMLVKWALESKRNTFEAAIGVSDDVADMSRSSVSDTLSEVDPATPPLDTDADASPGPGPLAYPIHPSDSLSRSNSDNARYATIFAKSAETEDASAMRRAAAEEKAIALRDDKLLSVAQGSAGVGVAGTKGERERADDPDHSPIVAGPTHALTHENMDKFEHAQEESAAPRPALAEASSRAETSSSLHVAGADSASQILARRSVAGSRDALARQDSAQTVTRKSTGGQ